MTLLTATLDDDGPRARLILRLGRIGLALAAGAAAALAHPPFGFLPGLAGYALLMFLAERSTSVRGGFWMGWLAGVAYFFISCWWVAEAFLVNPAQAWMAPFAASLLPIGLGLFWGTATALYRRFLPGGVKRVLFFAALFCLLEWLRGHVLTGFPWNPAGASWKAGSAASQFASIAGVYGLSFVTVAAAAAVGPLLGAGPRKARIGAAVLGGLVIAGLVIGGAVRLGQARLQLTDTVVRIVQADVDQESKWTPEAYRGIVDRYVNLTARPGAITPDLIIWPEGALPASANQVFAPGSPEAVAIARAVQPGQTLIMGLGRGLPDPSAPDGARYFNSLFVLKDQGDEGLSITGVYDKYRLVPFGEYLPAAGLLGALGVRSLTHMPTDFSAGPRPAPIDIPGAPRAQPLICYESLYPGFTPGAAGRPGWIVNISNDAWFGRTSGPIQHLNLASYRGIETGLPVVRSTPTGISAMIDPWGRVVGGQRLEPGESGVIDARLPRPTAVTFYGRAGDLLFWLAVLAGLATAAPWSRLRRMRGDV
ncbi:MAG: apolipoprotein N-acyltransferase [Brevundimonas sp.]|uniref:apolipoprotein N-acyltransferase n=1 Tax=Brevundimonas sp. TaxID=1871086 RepID=UPI00271A9274|nr:apolipoprotein N-acyltransferase [Brevundimonas sp.]MDO9587838.1 apolipoprotein N-acyltransferase [Brevundimonas sp.]MDP3370881.1 apolipoprotein N-acyltransferase [Brevundimonas sp.]MDP3658115.1 apolipoprotein N-acyltransferase [Brevundimonas sp.]MDZ4111380.1 apolipoprotein N-acyltransferase [Brevundimonas sp.]